MKNLKGMHPSGMTQERWDWPFKTPQERKLAAKYYQQHAKEEKQKMQDSLEEALL